MKQSLYSLLSSSITAINLKINLKMIDVWDKMYMQQNLN